MPTAGGVSNQRPFPIGSGAGNWCHGRGDAGTRRQYNGSFSLSPIDSGAARVVFLNKIRSQMIRYTTGNLLEAEVDALVNTVNCVGVMGKGIALQFKRAFPENTKIYERVCRAKQLMPGHMLVFATGKMVNPKFIINFPTK